MRLLKSAGMVALWVALIAPGRGEEPPPVRAELTNYFPPPESKGGWRSLLPENGKPSSAQKAQIADKTGVDWDRLQGAWEHAAQIDGASGLLVIRKGYIVGEWYKDGGRDKTFNIYSSSKAYTSLAFGLLLGDGDTSKSIGGRRLALDTRVCNDTWLPESLPLADSRKAEITLRQLLNMASGLGGQSLPTETEPFEIALGKTEKSPFRTLAADPGSKFIYSNAGVSHLVLVFHHATGADLFPYLKERVFRPLGVEQIRWEQIGGRGHIGPYSQGYSGIYTTPREHARFCYLALHKGNWGAKQVVPAAYYKFAWTPSKTSKVYGAQWWLEPRHKGAPPDLVQTAGALHNNGYVVPSLDLVFVRLGDGKKFPKDWEPELVQKVLAAVNKT